MIELVIQWFGVLVRLIIELGVTIVLASFILYFYLTVPKMEIKLKLIMSSLIYKGNLPRNCL